MMKHVRPPLQAVLALGLVVPTALAATEGRSGQPPAVRWTLLGARNGPPVAAADRSGRIVRDQVYPGISLTLESREGSVEYRFDVAAGANPGAIRLRYEGIEDLAVAPGGGALFMRAGGRAFTERGLTCFQEGGESRDEVACRYDVERTRDGAFDVALAVGPHDATRPLVIDPTISWSSYLGGSGIDRAFGITADAAGNLYLTGDTGSSDFPSTGGFDTSFGPSHDAFVTKVDAATATLSWSSYLGGSGYDIGYGIAINGTGDVFVCGETWSGDFPTNGGFDTSISGANEAFVTKVNASGAGIAWSSYLGGTGQDEFAYGVAVDDLDNAYLIGQTPSTDFPATGGFDSVYGGGTSDAFVTKVNAGGLTVGWSSFLGGSNTDAGNRGIVVDSGRNVYVTGSTYSSDFPATGGFDTVLDGVTDAFVTKVSPMGSLLWSSFLGGFSNDTGRGLAIDSAQDVYVTGDTSSPDFPVTAGSFDTQVSGQDAFVAKVTSAGALAWASFLGGNGGDLGQGIAVDTSGNIYVVGQTTAADFPATQGFQTSYGGNTDAFLARVDASGASLTWASYLGGSNLEEGYSVAVASGSVCATGITQSADFLATGGFDGALGGLADAFVTCVDPCAACGDGCCGASETPCGCPSDCKPVCSDGCCTGGETFCTCPGDCTNACGDGCCAAGEDTCTCDLDCGSSCGDGCCNGSETACDVGCDTECAQACGDGCCSGTETKCGCAMDCATDICGDGCCTGAEDTATCPGDCPANCGDGTCTPALEDPCNCAADCGTACGDGCCTGGETGCTCLSDCGDVCGDGCCSGAEDACTGPGCDTDCPSLCGDGCCTGAESACDTGCAAECPSVCGDACCTGTETQCDPGCAAECPALCGDGCCSGAEDCMSCANDCGACTEVGAEIPPDMGPTPDGPEPDGPEPDVGHDAGSGAEATVDGPSADVPAGADAGVSPPKDESVYGCPCQMGGRSDSSPTWLAILGLSMVFVRRKRGVTR